MQGLGIYSMAVLTTLLTLLGFGTLFRRLAPAQHWGPLTRAALLALPMFPLAFWGLRLPFLDPLLLRFAHWLHPELPPEALRRTWAYFLPKLWEAPFVEELAKLWPLGYFSVRKLLSAVPPPAEAAQHYREPGKPEASPLPPSFCALGLALGLGFGLGELWSLAYLIAQGPAGELPFWYFGGFLQERLLVTFCHGALTVLAVEGLSHARWRGLAGAMAGHFLLNAPIALKVFPPRWLPPTAVDSLLGVYLLVFAYGLLHRVSVVAYGRAQPGRLLLGQARCPHCQQTYARSLFGLSLGPLRYERCPYCLRWSWIGPADELP